MLDLDLEKNWRPSVELAKQGKSKAFDQQVIDVFQKFHKKALIPLVGSAEESWQVYLQAITKFWEKYVLAGKDLPQKNINGYIFMMCKNAYYDICRVKTSTKAQQTILLDDMSVVQHKIAPIHNSKNSTESDHQAKELFLSDQKYLKPLTLAIEKLCESCKAIIEENVLGNIKLIELRKKMNYGGGYQAIVQKKKRCMNKLTKYFFQELNKS